MTTKAIRGFCNRNKIYITAERKQTNSRINILKAHKKNTEKLATKKHCDFRVNPDLFLAINKPYIAYILGLLWADGYVLKNRNSARIEISSLASDLEEVKHLFSETGKWNIYKRARTNRRPQLTISTNNKVICQFLYDNNYAANSNGIPDKILSLIPDHLKSYWFRGLFDGDGCLYISKTAHQCSITSDYEQNWNFIEILLISLNIKYTIKRNVQQNKHNKIHTSSVIRITNKHDIKQFLSYIYQNRETDNIGYSRKYNKYLELTNMPDKHKTGPKTNKLQM